MNKYIIAWDLGATKCTVGLIEHRHVDNSLHCKRHITVMLADTQSLDDLVVRLEEGLQLSMANADAVCIGAAGHYDGHALYHANPYPYPMQFANLAKARKWPVFTVIHDYASIVCSTFTDHMQQAENVKSLNGCAVKTHGRRVALGMGTGLGLKDGVLFDNGDFWLGDNEAGHTGIVTPPNATSNELKRHTEIMRFLQQQKPQSVVTFEKILTGRGLANLYRFFYEDQEITPEEVGRKMQAGQADEVNNAFAWYAGLFTGTVQLTFMPEGGIWITGGVSIKHLNVFDNPEFMNGVVATPAYLQQRNEYPLGILRNRELALIGCGYYAAKRLL